MTYTVLPAGAVVANPGYVFGQATLSEVATALNQLGEAGHADWTYDMKWDTAPTGGVSRVDLTVVLSMKLPTWTHWAGRPKAERDEWERFSKALRFHEDGHHALARRESRVMYDRLVLARTVRNLRTVYAAEKARIARENKAFDSRTGHGAKQTSPDGTTVLTAP
ncbi:DUF922 domain-containing protein [Acidobacteria bacterium ACD]|nr:MAG: DUF922 domain-containing protein [Acidobacteriota bacterium]MCE7959955.1 DUF922 domain-containing protein [Acidobacteria bacterium ACB2]MDL1952551.1 DUF922 domain-containing protein [Acidobacteria bacterium ACD]